MVKYMRDKLRNLKTKRYATTIIIGLLLVFVLGLISLLGPSIKNIKIDKVLSRTTALNASVNDAVTEEVISNNYDEIKYQLKVNKDKTDTAIITGTLTGKESKYARFKEMKDAVISDNGKTITVTTTRSKVTITVIVSNAPYGTSINPKFNINSVDENKSSITVAPVVITGKSVEGKICDEKGTYYDGLELSLTKNGEEVKRTYTRDNGEYVFSLGDVDTYEVKLEEDKYQIVRYTEETTDENRRILNIIVKEVEPFNLEIKKTINKLDLLVNGKKETYDYDNVTKVVRSVKNAKTIEGSVYYNISIKNTGEIKGTLTVLKDKIPEGLSFDESKNPGWTKDGKYIYYTVIEGKEIDSFGKLNASLVLDIVKTDEAKSYINTAIASGDDYKYVAYYINNNLFREEYVISTEKIQDINPNIENFAGWYTDKNFTNKYDFNNQVSKDTVLFGKINNNKYAVTFIDINPNNDEETILDIVEVNEGSSADLVDAPNYDGYTFKCFKLNDECYESEEITEDVNLYTSYTVNQYDITYDLDGGTLEEENPDIYTIKYEITLNNPTKEGYTFIGWTGTGLSEPTLNVIIPAGSIGNRSYTANYEINKSTLTINPNGGTYLDNSSSVSYTKDYGTIMQIADSVRRGYKFTEYTKTGGGSFNNGTYTFNNDDATLTANYEIITYRIRYEKITEAEKNALNNPIIFNVETETFTLNEPSTRLDDDGNKLQDFLGWDDGSGNTSINVTIPKGSIDDRTYTAVWKENEDSYTITYNTNGGTASSPNPNSYTRQTNTFTLNNPSKTGYNFTGWSGTGIDGLSTVVTIPKGSAGNRTYTANYEIIPYTITYENITDEERTALNNPTGYNVETETFTLSNPNTRLDGDGNKLQDFLGWDDGNGNVSKNVTITQGTTGNKTYTAVWKENDDSYSITYELNGGIPSSPNPSTYTRATETFTLNPPSKDGYNFIGWSGTNLIGNTNIIVTIPKGSAGDREYTANYEAISYTITYKGLTNVEKALLENPITYNVETNTFTLNNPTSRLDDKGYPIEDFVGWDDGSGNVSTNITITKGTTGNKTYTATWVANVDDYSITYSLDGGTPSEPNPSTYNRQTESFTLHNPSKNGYTFLGWSGTDILGLSTSVTVPKGSAGDRLYYAYYQAIPYSISYNGLTEEEINAANNPSSYNVETETFGLTNPIREGYQFTGWSGTGITNKSTSVTVPRGSTGNRVYTAHFEKLEYSLTYTYNGGVPSEENPSKYSIDSAPITLHNPSKNGYTFIGWSGTDLVGNENTEVTIPTGSTGHRSFLANYNPITYHITYDYNGGELEEGATNPSTYTIETPDISFNTPVKEGYIFTNYTFNGEVITGIPTGTIGDINLVANYEIRKYNVNCYNESALFNTEKVDWNTSATRPANDPTKAHHVFLYWSEDGVNEYNFNTPITADKNLYAIYEEVIAPEISISPTLDDTTNRTWVCGDSSNNNCGVTVTVSSEHSDYDLYYKVGDGPATLYTEPFKVYENTIVTAWSKKSNINSESVEDTITNVDTIAPTINQPWTGAMSFNITVNGTMQDASSGIKKYTMYAKEKSALVYDDTFTYVSPDFDGLRDHSEDYAHTFYGVQDDTEYIVKIVAEDYVGNTSEIEVEVKTNPYVARVVGKNGILWYTVDPDTKEMIVDEGKEFLLFDSIQSAVNYCANVQCTIQTNPTQSVINESVTVAANQDITIDLDGRGIASTDTATFTNNGKLQIVDRNPRLNGEEHESIGFVSNPTGKAIVNNNILIIGDGSSEPSETFIVPELDRPIIDGKVTAIEQNKELHFYDGRIESDTLAITNNGDDVITQYSYNVIITTDEVTGQNVASMARVKDPEARIRSTYYAKLNINSAEDAVTSSRKGTVTSEQAKLLSKIKQAGDYGFTYDSVNDKIYIGNQSTVNTTSLSYLKLDLIDETEDRFIVFDTLVDTFNTNSYGYVSVSETFGQTGTQIYKTTGNDITGTKIYELKKGKVYYIYFGFVKGGGDINKYENFEIYNFRLLGSKQETTDLRIYSDSTNYPFVKQEDGSYVSSNAGVQNSYSHSYIIYDLRNQTDQINLYVNVTIDAHTNDVGYIYLSDNEALQSADTTAGRYVYTSGAVADVTYTVPLVPGQVNYVHFGYWKNNWGDDRTDSFTINSISLSKTKGEELIPSSTATNDETYYFQKADYEPYIWKDSSSNGYNATLTGVLYDEEKKGFYFNGAHYGVITSPSYTLDNFEETVYVEYSTTSTGNAVLYGGTTNERITIGQYSGYIIVSSRVQTYQFLRPATYADGNKHSLMVTLKDGVYKFYYDGVEQEQSNWRNWWSWSNTNNYIGYFGADNAYYFNGYIYDIKAFDKELTPEELNNTENLILHLDGNNAKVSADTTTFISNNHNITSSTAHSYLTYDLTNVNEDKYLYINTSISSQANYDFGYVQVTDSSAIPTNLNKSEIKVSGELDNQYKVFKLKKNQVNYVHFLYVKDNWGNTGLDRFVIKEVKYCNTLADAYSVNPSNYSKVDTMYFEKANLNTEVDTIELLKDITLDYSIVIPQEKEVVLDLNGFTITSNINDHIIKNSGKLAIKDSSYDDRVKQNVDYKLEQARLFEEASEQYLADLAEYEEYAGLCEDCEPSAEYIFDKMISPTEFSIADSDQVYKAFKSTNYILEVWGGQGGGSLNNGTLNENEGYGGYSVGTVSLNEGDILYINVGGKGTNATYQADAPGGYNGGGSGTWDYHDDEAAGGGGGATHIALESGLLSTFEDKQDKLLIVAGGGGGRSWGASGGSGGGFTGGADGGNRTANQLEGYAFGQGQNATGTGNGNGHGGGGGGYYGGYESNRSGDTIDSGGGGSGYIGNELLTNKSMYCYNCLESGDPETKTISVNTYSEEPTANTPKKGDGYARITPNLSEEELEALYNNVDKRYNVKEEPKFINYLYGIDFDGTININQLTPESTPTYNNTVEEYASGAITSTIANAIINEEYATLILESGLININKDSKIAIENRGNLTIKKAEINANNASTIGVFNETNANISFVDGVINAKGSSSVGLLNRSNQPSISNAKVVTTPTNAIGIKNESLENVTYSNLDISGAGIGFRELSVGSTYIVDSSIKSTGNRALFNVSGATPGELIISSSTLSGNIVLGNSAERVTINNSTFEKIYNSYGYLTISNSNFNYLENKGKTNIIGSTITGSDTLIYSYGGEDNGTWSSWVHDSKVLLKNSTLNSTATSTNVNVIRNYDSMTIDNVTINNTKGTKSTAINNVSNNFPENSDLYPYGTGAYLNIPGTINIDPTFGTAINNTGIVILGTDAKNAETQYEYSYTGHQEEFVAPVTGTYKLETWGAAGANTKDSRRYRGWTHFLGGYGAYASGNIELTEGEKLYIHVGGAGTLGYLGAEVDDIRGYYGSYNGGGASIQVSSDYFHGAGGGATDISLSDEDDQIYYDNGAVSYKRSAASYAQRILVAGGGSGCGWQLTCYGGYNVDPSESNLGYGNRSGGGGYYGGSYGFGGSSYASNTLTNTVLINGREEMPDYNTSSGFMRGNNASGYARITLLDTTTDDTVKSTPNITATNYGIVGSGTVRFLDGTINAKVAVSSDIELVAENYDIYNSKDSNNNDNMILVANADSRPVAQGEEEFVAAIGNAKYTTIQNAIDASNNGDEIDLLVNIEQQNMINIPSNKVITIDYNGHTVKSYNPKYLYKNLGNLTIKDSTNTLAMNTFTGDKYIYNEGTLSLNNIYIDNNEYYAINLIENNDGIITMNGVKLEMGDGKTTDKVGIKNSENGTITIQNSTINLNYNNKMFDNYGTLTIKDSTFNSYTPSYNHTMYQVYNNEGATTVLDGNTHAVTGDSRASKYLLYNEGTATIKNMNSHIELVGNSSILTLETNNFTSGTLNNTGLLYINSGTYSNTFNINDGGKTIDDTENLYSLIMRGGTINTTLNINTTNISNIESGTISVASGYAINNTTAGIINLGIKDSHADGPNVTKPVITGKTYGIYTSNASLIVNFYDGIISGEKSYNVTIGEIESGYSIHREFDNNVETKYLTQEAMFVNDTHAAEYNTIAELNTALSDGSIVDNDVIKVYRDITIVNTDASITVPNGLHVKFDINGKTVDKNNPTMFIVNGELDVMDSVTNSTGKIDSTTGNTFSNNGTLNIISGNYISEQFTSETELIKNNIDGTLNISGGTFTKYYDYLGFVQIVKGSIVNNSGTANVAGGKFYTNASHSSRTMYIFSSVVFDNKETGTLTVTGGDYDGIIGYTRNYDGVLTGNYKTWFNQDSQARGTLIYNYGTASIEDITSNQANIGYNSGTLTLDNVTMNNIYQMTENGWNSESGGFYNFVNTGTTNIIDSNFEIRHSFVDNKGGTLNIENTTIDKLSNGINYRYSDDNAGLCKNSHIVYNYATGEVNITDSNLYNRGSGEVIQNKGLTNVTDSTLEAASNNVIINTAATTNVKGDSSIVSNSGNYSGITLSNSSTLNLGEPIEIDGTVSQTKPFVKGVTYGINNSGSTFNFYDGLIEGQTLANSGTFNTFESGYTVIYDTDGDYKSNYLDRIPIVQNITQATSLDEHKYYDLKTAFADANDGDTLSMIADYSSLPTDETAVNNRNVTFDINGKILRQSNNILIQNNGTLNITDNSQNGDGNVMLLSGTNIINNDGIINFIGGKLSSNLAGSTIIKNIDPSSVLTIKDNAILDSSTTAKLIDNSGTTNIYNGAYLHNVNANAILNKNILNIVDLNNDNDNSTSSNLNAPWIYLQDSYNSYRNPNPYAIYTYANSTTNIYGGIFGSTSDLNTACESLILSNSGTTNVYNLNTNVHHFTDNSGILNVKDSYFHYSAYRLIINSGTLTIEDTTFEISDSSYGEKMRLAGTTTLDNITVIGKNSSTTYAGSMVIVLGTLNIRNSNITARFSDSFLRNESNTLIENSTIVTTTGIYNRATLNIDASSITTDNYIVENQYGTTNIRNNSTLTSLNSYGLNIYNTSVLNINYDNTIIANNGAGIILNNTAKLTLGTMGGTPSTEHPYIEGSTYGVRNDTYTTTFNFYDGLIVGQTGPNAVFGGVSNVESEYETESVQVTDPDTQITKYYEYLVHSASYVAVAKVGNYTFTAAGTISPSQALQNAINFAIGDGTNVNDVDLLTSVDLVNDGEIITASMPVTINLYGNTINQSSTYNLSSNITLNNNTGVGASVSKLLGNVFSTGSASKDILIYELSDGSKLDTTKTYKLYKDGNVISLEKEELGRYKYKGNTEDLTSVKGRLYIDNLSSGSYKLVSSDNKSIEFSIDSDGKITGNVIENTRKSSESSAVANSEAELILQIQTGKSKNYYWLLIIPITLLISLLIIINKNKKRES